MLLTVCWAARPSTIAVNAPPTASVPIVTPAIRSAATTTTVSETNRTRKPTVPAMAGSSRR
jgi:hypothetical protein